ncbi:Stk1 family PASTA domain-containing Ser/Thr kinase [Lacticaseibacillus mingshuiensis]|uniref:non-specific serine/threonine protein kinase n=1 Tax=Lacticaseibacillus mingshuiensis TaxID=2799574 RepID=A0ABW4CIG6_9LACO|nr:Stk1 family PASTA domain-containing Ser/Thr kinase [Lacticaseibacillus mingshuiensis]
MIEPGNILNERYQLLKTLGEGGMANVYLAHDLILDRDVAVKVLRLDLQNDPDTIRRFQREAMATSELVHPNIVSIYDVGESHGQQYLVMEYVHGTDLKKYIVEHFPIPYQRVIDIMAQILSGVQLAHDHNIIHRDLKPQNILIDEDGNAKITDFGIAVALSDNSMTQTNSLLGSVHYLSPEQARGGMPTKQSDIYALGIILFEMLTGTVPFEGDSAVSIALKHFQEDMPAVRDFDPRIPQALENVVLKATAKEPADRYTSAAAMADDLKTALSASRAHEPKFVAATNSDLDETKVLPSAGAVAAASAAAASTQPASTQAATTDSAAKKRDNKNAKKQPTWTKYWPLIVAGVALLALIAFLIFAFTGAKGDVNVPDLRGMTQTQAKSALKAADLELGKVSKANSNTVAKNRVIRSEPGRKTSVKSKSKVDIVLSKGVEKFTVDDYTGELYDDVHSDLKSAGFTVKKTEKEDDAPEGTILSQSLKAGSKVVPADETITLTVSKGPKPIVSSSSSSEPEEKTVTVPDFIGQSADKVSSWASENGMKVIFEDQESDTIAKGDVISVSPASGSTLTAGETLTVARSTGAPASSSSSESSSSEPDDTSSSTPTVKSQVEAYIGKTYSQLQGFATEKGYTLTTDAGDPSSDSVIIESIESVDDTTKVIVVTVK